MTTAFKKLHFEKGRFLLAISYRFQGFYGFVKKTIFFVDICGHVWKK